MTDREFINSIEYAIDILQTIDQELTDFFSEASNNSGFFRIRAEYLQQFGVLAGILHQFNTINFLSGTFLGQDYFKREVETSESKLFEFKAEIINTIGAKMNFLIETRDKFADYDNQLMAVKATFLEKFSDKAHMDARSKTFTSNPQGIQSLIFSIEEIRSKILQPTHNIIESEINTGQKIIDAAVMLNTKNHRMPITREEVARFCELFTMGQDVFPAWQDIREANRDASKKIKDELGNLRKLLFFPYEYSKNQ